MNKRELRLRVERLRAAPSQQESKRTASTNAIAGQGEIMEQIRKRAGFSQPELAQVLEISPGQVYNIEKGQSGLSVKRLLEWSWACDADPVDVLRDIVSDEKRTG